MIERPSWRRPNRQYRHLDWDGSFNARDLGGLRTADEREIRRGAVVRSAAPDLLTEAGWKALYEYGIRTIVDLRNDGEGGPDTAPRPADIAVVRVSLEDYDADAEFWKPWRETGQWATPLYYQAYLDRFPQQAAAAVAAVANAGPGCVLVHCAIGRDRTGLVTLLLLALAGVAPDDIAADFELSTDRLRPMFAHLGLDDDGPAIQEIVTREQTTLGAAIIATVESLDVDAYLLKAGLTGNELAALRNRLVG